MNKFSSFWLLHVVLESGFLLNFDFLFFCFWGFGFDCAFFLISGGAAVDAEKSKAAGVEALRAKKRLTKLTKSSQKVAWGKLLSQCSQVGFMFNSVLKSWCCD